MERSSLVKDLEEAFGDLGATELGVLLNAERTHRLEFDKVLGFLTLANASKSFFLETVGELNGIRSQIQSPLPSEHAFLMLNVVGNFRSLRASELIAINGYPLQGFMLLRNVYDSCVLSAAVVQGMTTFDKLAGVDETTAFDPDGARARRIKEERSMRRLIDGRDSGLSDEIRAELKSLNDLFDAETHGSRLSQSQSLGWLTGQSELKVVPMFSEKEASMFFNRYHEVAWMAHRLLPSTKPHGYTFSASWRERWALLDRSFSTMVMALTIENQKPIGQAIRTFVELKFPFSAG